MFTNLCTHVFESICMYIVVASTFKLVVSGQLLTSCVRRRQWTAQRRRGIRRRIKSCGRARRVIRQAGQRHRARQSGSARLAGSRPCRETDLAVNTAILPATFSRGLTTTSTPVVGNVSISFVKRATTSSTTDDYVPLSNGAIGIWITGVLSRCTRNGR